MRKLFPISVLLVAAGLNAQTPPTCGLASAFDDNLCVGFVSRGFSVTVAQMLTGMANVGGAASKLEDGTIQSIWAQQALDETKEAIDIATLATKIAAVLPTAVPIIIPACAISGVEGQDLVHGSRQDSSDPTYKCKAGWIKAGEHLIYTVYIPAPGAYTFTAGVASVPGTGAFHLEITGQLRSGYVSVPQTATWSAYAIAAGGTVNFAESGVVSFDVVSDTTNDFDLLWLEFSKK
jgi:carbohydrate binding protein with CBM6 domain